MIREATLPHVFGVAGAVALAAFAFTVSVGLPRDTLAPDDDVVVTGHATYRSVPSIEALSQEATLVVAGSVVGDGKTRMIVPTHPQVQPADSVRRSIELPEAKKTESVSGAPSASLVPAVSLGQPVTAFTVRVARTLKGAAKPGSTITVMQLGGTVSVGAGGATRAHQQVLEFEHDPLMRREQEHVLFLKANADGTYAAVGGPQGRFPVDRAGRLQPLDRQAPTARAVTGKTVDDLATQVERSRFHEQR